MESHACKCCPRCWWDPCADCVTGGLCVAKPCECPSDPYDDDDLEEAREEDHDDAY